MTALRPIFVLGTNHRLQGSPVYPKSVNDPGYAEMLKSIISTESVDFIFEEASQCGPTTAQRLARSLPIGYLDVDPHPDLAYQSGIVTATGQPFPRDISHEEKVEVDAQREELWCKRIAEQDFKSGLVICGCLHTLSVAFRLRAVGLGVKFGQYIPHEQLCTRPHAS